MPRLFIAIDLPAEIKDHLGRLCSGVPGAKWVKREQMHLTLRFIGAAAADQFEAIKTTLAKVQTASFEMQLEGIGQFPTKGKPRVLWVGVKAPAALMQLQHKVSASLDELDIAPEDHPFSPHITLGRLKTAPPTESVRQFFAKHAAFKTDLFPVQTIILFSSVLAPQGATYRQESVIRLNP